MNIKVVHIYKDYYPPVRGGIEGHINLLASGLKKKGVHVEVLVSNTYPKFEKTHIDGIPITKIPQIGRFASAPLNISFSIWIRKLGFDADLLHFHFPNPTAEISYLISSLNKPVVITYHSDIIRQARLLKLYSPLMRQFLNQATKIIVTSPNYLESSPFLAEFREKCRLIPFGIELSDFSAPLDTERILSIRDKYRGAILLFIGRFRYYKGLHVLIEAMRHIEGTLLLIGAGPLETNLRKHVRQANLEDKVIFLGEISDKKKIGYLHACDIFVLPSIYRSEAFGIVQLEAMACSKPVVCTELGTGTSFVNQHHKTGLVVPPHNVEALRNAINFLLKQPTLRSDYGQEGYRRVETYFSKEKMVNDVLELYSDILARQRFKTLPLRGEALGDYRPIQKIKILRIISRLNIGGPSIHAYLLTKGLNNDRFETILVTGRKSRFEGDMSYLFDSSDYKPVFIKELQRELNLKNDLKAFFEIFKIIYREHPDIVHTHTTKAGASARFAVFLYKIVNRKKIKTVHTFHGHVFTGYFNQVVSRLIVWIERFLMKLTDVIVSISESQKWELTRKYDIAPSYKVVTKELGFDLTPFIENIGKRGQFRKKLGVGDSTTLVGIIGRLAPIKNHKMFLNAAKDFSNEYPQIDVKFVIVGDGELHAALEKYSREFRLEKYILFYGWARDVSVIYSDLDILALTSLNEGTPVSVIEAMASGVPVISTDAGGVVDLVGVEKTDSLSNGFRICERGILCRKDDNWGFSKGLRYLIEMDPQEKEAMLNRAKKFVREKYTQERLIQNMEKLYIELMRNAA